MATESESKLRQLIVLEAKRNCIYERLNNIYVLSKDAHLNEENKENFLSSVNTLELLRSEFQTYLDQYNSLELEINPKAKPNYQPLVSFDDLYSRIKRVISFVGSALSPQNPNNENCGISKAKPRLPPIELSTFDGDLLKWPLFHQQFKDVIHNNPRLSDSERVHYLVGRLTDKALSICAGIPPTADNYAIIWEALVQRYEDTRSLATSYLNQLFEFKPLLNTSTAGLDIFMEKFAASISALKKLNIDDLLDFIFLYFSLRKLDPETAKLFEMATREVKIPTYDSLIKFVKEQSKIISRTNNDNNKVNKQPQRYNSIPKVSTKSFISTNNVDTCIVCQKSDHEHLYQCREFTKMTPQDRYKLVKRHNFCNNCLSKRHRFAMCKSTRSCLYCNLRHHSLLHFNIDKHSIAALQPSRNASSAEKEQWRAPTTGTATATSFSPRITPENECSSDSVPANTKAGIAMCASHPRTPTLNTSMCSAPASDCESRNTTTLLGTAKILVYDCFGREHIVRCLIDPGSQSDYISAKCCKLLSLPISKHPRYSEVYGIGGSAHKLLGSVSLKFKNRFGDEPAYLIEPLVVSCITGKLPDTHIDTSFLNEFSKVQLADDSFYLPGDIDVLLGVKIYTEILLFNKIKSKNNAPTFLETTLGYILLGDAPTLATKSTHSFCSLSQQPLETILEGFWKLEEVPAKKYLSPEEQQCESIYSSAVTRDPNGRYAVDLPFKKNPDNLGDSYFTAKKRFFALERKFKKCPEIRIQYDEVIREYLNKTYLSIVTPAASLEPGCFIPHHPVIRKDKSSTKLRVVLDASAKTDNGLSLNDVLHTGCNLQADIFQILLDVRLFRVAFFADVRQMYLCIGVHEPHRKYQRILYRFSSDDPLQTYEFNRVAFGLRSSPFLALRTLRQLAKDERDNYPLAAEVLERDVYMDDLASSACDSSQAIRIAEQLIHLFRAGGFDLVKWTSNSPELLEHIPSSHRQYQDVSFSDGDQLKILGLRWHPANDYFNFNITIPHLKCTKRTILSMTARLYDVLGLVGPVILFAKLIMKELWLLKIDWDSSPPQHIVDQWQQYVNELPLLSNIKFPRHLGVERSSSVSLVGYSDASQKGYGCVLYLHVQNDNEPPVVTLICAKSRVAPMKFVTLARLELCAAVLLTKLIRVVYDTLSHRHPIKNTYAFSDSTVTLHWISSSPHRFNTFVANRIAQCQSNLSPEHFYHVSGTDNPADCLSRGLMPSQLVEHKLWFEGPAWLALPRNEWPIRPFLPTMSETPEEKTTSHIVTSSRGHPFIALSLKFSCWNKLLRSVAYVLKFIRKRPLSKINSLDLEAAELEIVKAIQRTSFPDDIIKLQKKHLSSPSLRKLSPFLKNDVIRVGGRLSNSSLEYSQKHPILLPKNGHTIEMLIDDYHRKNCHAGPQLLLAILRQKFWILSARNIIRSRIHKCNTCFKLNPRPIFPIMADLPACRVEQCTKAFIHTGVDYAGPLHITISRRRGVRSQKAYICLFVCLVTRAIHIELASDLSSATFLDALKRFLSRRGPCKYIYSDNGTNFVSSKAYLDELHQFLKSDSYYVMFNEELVKNRIEWRMNPPSAPHFGGIWEANIKSVKSHLFRVIGKQILTYEEMITVLNQIECVLNSRPLYILSSDPSDPSALTPSHFLSTAPLEFLPAANVDQERLVSRFALMDSLVKSFWRRWNTEYLHNLQTREKWNTESRPVELGTVVIIMTDNTPPLQWPLGIITRIFPGKDGVTRVAEVRTRSGTYKRPIVRLCPLPSQ